MNGTQEKLQQISEAPVEEQGTHLEQLLEQLLEKRTNLSMTQSGFEPTNMEEAWRFAQALAGSGMVPDKYVGKPRDCLVVLDLAKRLKCSWLAVMQHVYNVHGRVSMEAVLVIALTNQSKMFVDPLEYEVRGDDARKPDFSVRAFATRKSTGAVLYGPWIDWPLVKGEGWHDKKGSKWLTMPEQMFHYRAASWFVSRHCPEVKMGMLTTDEAAEIPREPVTFDEAEAEAKEQIETEQGSEVVETPAETPAAPQDEERSKIEAEKAKLREAEAKAKAKGKGKKAKAGKDKDAKPKYHCNKCGKDFDVPNATDVVKGVQCKCLSWATVPNEPDPDDGDGHVDGWPDDD